MEEKERTGKIAGAIEPVQLTGKSRLRFRCHQGLSCWNLCCRAMNIMLTPYDILRLKRRLGISSEEFLARYSNASVHEESGLPLATLRFTGGEDDSCPFKTPEGCSVYEDRPSICRYYPIGLANLRAEKGEGKEIAEERFYFLIREDYCQGHGEDREWTVDEYRRDQGASRDDEINRDWRTAFLSRALPGQQRHDEKRQALFFMTCYNLDAFRRFVFESAFLEKFDVDGETVEKMRSDDEELLRFALSYMKFFMMIEKTMKPRGGVVEDWQKKHRDEVAEQTGIKPPAE